MKFVYDAVLYECPGDKGLTKDTVDGMIGMLSSSEFYPVEFYADHAESSAIGFITREAAKFLDFDYDDLKAVIGGVLDDLATVNPNGQYKCDIDGLKVIIIGK